MDKQKWCVLELDDGWQAILPDYDIKPHSKVILIEPNGKQEGELAGFDCPCKPQIDFKHKLVIHNSFEEENAKK